MVLLRATLPASQDAYRDLTASRFEQQTGAAVKRIPNTSHMLHWDNPERVVEEIRNVWLTTK